MSLSLYHIDQALEALIDPETGELLDYDAFEQMQMDREHKIENMVCWSKSLDAEAKAIRDEEKELAERRCIETGLAAFEVLEKIDRAKGRAAHWVPSMGI